VSLGHLYVVCVPTSCLQKGDEGDAFGRTIGDINTANRVKQLKKEVAVREG